MSQFNKYYKGIIGIMELGLAIPIVGGLFIIANAYVPLMVMFILHIIGIFISAKTNQPKSGHILGAFGNIIAFIPVVGMILHAIIGLVLVYQAFTIKAIKTN